MTDDPYAQVRYDAWLLDLNWPNIPPSLDADAVTAARIWKGTNR